MTYGHGSSQALDRHCYVDAPLSIIFWFVLENVDIFLSFVGFFKYFLKSRS